VITDIDVDIGECQVDPTDGQLKRKVTFTPTVTGPDPTAYEWTFGDGTTKSDPGPPGPEEHLYEAKPGEAPQLCIEGPDACPQTCQEVPLSEFDTFEPCADFTAFIEYDVTDCLKVTFTGSATGGEDPYEFDWDFGDGVTGEGDTVTHAYSETGIYDVTLTVTDKDEKTATAEETLTLCCLEASASADPERAILDEITGEATIEFTFSATGGKPPCDFVWDFADDSEPQGIENTTTATFTVTHTYTITGTYQVTLDVTDALGCSDEDTVVVTVSSEEAENLVGHMLARFFNITNDEINRLRDSGWGYGEIAKAYFIAQLSGKDVEVIIAMRGEGKEGSGWGQIMKDVLAFAGLRGYNLGLIMSGREVPAPVQNLADFCQMEVEELTELLRDTEANFSTIRKACRLAQEVDGEEATLQEIIERRQAGTSWREIREESGLFSKQMEALARGCSMEGNVEELANLIDQWGRQTVKRACRLAQASGVSVTVTEVLEMLDGGMTWDQIKEDLGLVAEQGSQGQGSQGQGHDKGDQGQGHGKGQQGQPQGKGKGPKQ